MTAWPFTSSISVRFPRARVLLLFEFVHVGLGMQMSMRVELQSGPSGYSRDHGPGHGRTLSPGGVFVLNALHFALRAAE